MLGISILREQERWAQTAFRFTDLGLLRWWESGAEKERQVASEIQAGAKGDLDSVMAEEEKTGGQIWKCLEIEPVGLTDRLPMGVKKGEE